MADRRMFAKTIVLSDAFLDMPMSARCLYMTLGMLADDDGFVNAPRSVMRQCGASDDDMRILIAKRFVLVFDSGVIVIKHWRINNYLRSDRYTPTKYDAEKASLALDDNGAYTEKRAGIPGGIPRLGKDSIGKDSIDNISPCISVCSNNTFTPPTVEEVEKYSKESGYPIDAKKFVDHYTSNGWMAGATPVADWKARVRVWSAKDRQQRMRSKVYLDDRDYTEGDMDEILARLEENTP